MMWQMANTFATRFGAAPFAELVSEIQHRFHAEIELIYLAAANFYGQVDVKSCSAFDDPGGYAGSTPSVPYLKGLFTDFMAAHRIYVEREIGSLPCTSVSLDHTFDVSSSTLFYLLLIYIPCSFSIMLVASKANPYSLQHTRLGTSLRKSELTHSHLPSHSHLSRSSLKEFNKGSRIQAIHLLKLYTQIHLKVSLGFFFR